MHNNYVLGAILLSLLVLVIVFTAIILSLTAMDSRRYDYSEKARRDLKGGKHGQQK